MSCPVCDHTMDLMIENCWWCPRCGTISTKLKDVMATDKPWLVTRCRQFQEAMMEADSPANFLGPITPKAIKAVWVQVGIEESISP